MKRTEILINRICNDFQIKQASDHLYETKMKWVDSNLPKENIQNPRTLVLVFKLMLKNNLFS